MVWAKPAPLRSVFSIVVDTNLPDYLPAIVLIFKSELFWYLMYGVQCGVYDVRCTVYDVQCEVYGVGCTMWGVRCEVYDVQCGVYRVGCTV